MGPLSRRSILIAPLAAQAASPLRLPLRSRVESPANSGKWTVSETTATLDPARTAVVVCDMWDRHWCRGATERVNAMVPRMNHTLVALRSHGVLIIHAPSDTMEFYKDAPQRRAILDLPRVEAPPLKALPDPPLPIDDSGGGCDTPGDTTHKAWTRQHPGLAIMPADYISDRGEEIYSALRARRAERLIVMGVHTNMCILNRTFAIKRMTRWGVPCVLVRDLTDAMYNPADRPYVSHEQGTQLVIEHIEKHWCPTTTSEAILRATA